MSIGEIEVAVRQSEERNEMSAAFSQLLQAHQELSFFERRASEDAEKIIGARVHLDQAIIRMEGFLKAVKRQ